MVDITEEIKSKIDIVDLVLRYVPIKKSGTNYKANCPFHNEDTPSFMVSPALQIFKCFGCGKGGDIFTFLMELEGIEFKEAVQRLGEEAGVDMSKYNKNANNKSNQQFYDLNDLVKKYYSYTLLNLSIGKEALKYLKNRGLSKAYIEDFGLGYAPDSWNSLFNYLIKKSFKPQILEQAGLVKKGSGGTYYDSYRARVMFPLINEREQTVGFAGRTLINEDPKYINTKETPIFHKSSYIYNLNKAKMEIKRKNQVIVSEGEFDAITPYIKGIKNVVALKGTSFTEGQAKLLKRYTEEAIIFFDNDTAGQDAAIRGVEIAQNTGLNVKIAKLTGKYKDPDEAANENINILLRAIEKALPAYDFYFAYITRKYDPTEALDKTKIVSFLRPKIQNIKDPVLKAHYTKKLSELIDIPENTLEIPINNYHEQNKSSIKNLKDSGKQKTNVEVFTDLFTYLLRSKNSVFKKFYKKIQKQNLLSKKESTLLKKYYISVIEQKIPLEDFLVDHKKLRNVFLVDIGPFDETEKIQVKTIEMLLLKLKRAKIKKDLDEISNKIKTAERLNKADKLDKLQKEFNILARQLSHLNN